MKPVQSAVITIDGSQGEGGGQILRTSLSLAMITGRAFKIINIRANRKQPGLLRQHLTAVKATAAISDAKVIGAELGSKELFFIPNTPKAGHYHFVIGTAGSTTLVAQTLIPALILAKNTSTVTIEGGTHNGQSPPYDFLVHSFLPILKKMGIEIEARILNYGFYPAGGGKITLTIKPARELQSIQLIERGKQKHCSAEAWFANLGEGIPKRELDTVGKLMGWPQEKLHICPIKKAESAGNFVVLKLEYDALTETFVSFGKLGLKAEKVAKKACADAKKYLSTNAAVSTHLADQLLLPMILAGGGKFTTLAPSSHTQTNIEVIKQFIPCDIQLEEKSSGQWLIDIGKVFRCNN